MAEVYGYFNGLEYDEKFPMMRVASLIPTGVYNDSLHVSAGTGLTVYVAAGKAWVNGYFYSSDATKQITIDIADADNTRKDIIVLRLDTVNRLMEIAYKKGNPSVYPTPPTLQRNNDLYELQLAEILVPAGSASISAATITDTRSDSGLCGITAGFQGLDVNALTAQAQAQFDAWFQHLQDQLDSNQAGNLQNQIDTINSSVDAINNSKGKPNGIAGLGADGIVPVEQLYTVGNWNPVLHGSQTAGSFSYSLQRGIYIKIGKLVFFEVGLSISSVLSVPLGEPFITIPFPTDSDAAASVAWVFGGSGDAMRELGIAHIAQDVDRIVMRKIIIVNSKNSIQSANIHDYFSAVGTATGGIFLSGTYIVS